MAVQICLTINAMRSVVHSFLPLTCAMNECISDLQERKNVVLKRIHFIPLPLECDSLAEMVITTEVENQRNVKRPERRTIARASSTF